MKILELFQNSIKLLEKNNIPTSKLDTRILISYILRKEKKDINSKNLLLYFNKNISIDFENKFNELLKRRLNREPIANIIGVKNFWELEFDVNENVLTPRNDSEILIESIIKNQPDFDKKLKILDLGTGSGCLILTLLKIYKNSQGLAVDISKKSIDIAKKNANKLKINNVNFLINNWNDDIEEKFDIIISNPPYIPTNEIQNLEPEVNIFNPIISLDGGSDGLNCYKYISNNIRKNINKNAELFFEIGVGQSNNIIEIFKKNNFNILNIYKDLSKIDRVLHFSCK